MSAPPPPPPASSAAIPPPPPPPPPPISDEDKEEQEKKKMALQETVVAAATALEKGRCLETEVEAALLVSSCLLRHAPGTSMDDMGDYPGGVKDACRVLEDLTKDTTIQSGGGGEEGNQQPQFYNNNNNNNNMMNTTTATNTDNHHNNNHDDDNHGIQIPGGSLGKAVHTLALSTCLTRAAAASQSIVKQRDTSEQLLKQAMSATTTDISSSAWLLDIMDTKLRDIRDYHARHDTATTLLQQQQNQQQQQQQPPHKKIRTTLGQPIADGYDLASLVREETSVSKLDTLFAPDEIMGKYLDLGNVYERHVELLKLLFMEQHQTGTTQTGHTNTNHNKQVPYIDFLSFLTNKGLALWAEQDKLNHRKKYMRFLLDMGEYLKGFLQRTSPLFKVEEALLQPAENEFHETWRLHGGCPGYHYIPAEASLAIIIGADNTTNDKNDDHPKEKVDLTPYNSPEELHTNVDAGILKTELSRLGLKCGGTPLDRAKRLFQTKDTPLDKLPKKLFAKGSKRTLPQQQQGGSSTATNATSTSTTITTTTNTGRRFDLAKTEAIVTMLLDQLRPHLEATLRRAERRTTQTNKERMQEVEEELYGNADGDNKTGRKKEDEDGNVNDDSDDSDDDDEPIYNPKGVPLGWDGKPIPYWLFKLHGLNHFYPCEICGGESYRGRRNFEKHFAEAKHAYGMKCLGIPNTQHFHGVTKIEDAQQLWKSLESKMKEDKFDDRKEEEYEDSHGNVLSRATYEDLARQGLL